jgi:Kef-type K+ transport system membrane component KefB
VSIDQNLFSLLVIVAIAAAVPVILGFMRIRIAEVVLLLVGGVIFGPEVLGWIQIDDSIDLLAEVGLGMLFFLAGMELEPHAVQGRSGKLAAIGWLVSLSLALIVSLTLDAMGLFDDGLAVAIALVSTALGTLLPIMRDSGLLSTKFGTYFMGAGAWGELGPIIAISVLLGSQSSFLALITLGVFGVIAVALAILPARMKSDRLARIIERGHTSSSQTAVRLTVLLMIALLALADVLGFDVVLGAFIAGIIVRRYLSPKSEHLVQSKVETIAFGLMVPLFFVVSGARLDIIAIIENPLMMLGFFILIFAVRGVPQFFVYRHALPDVRERARLSLYIATALPIIVAVTSLQVEAGLMDSQEAAALIGAGALTVLVFPLLAQRLGRRSGTGSESGLQDNRSGD